MPSWNASLMMIYSGLHLAAAFSREPHLVAGGLEGAERLAHDDLGIAGLLHHAARNVPRARGRQGGQHPVPQRLLGRRPAQQRAVHRKPALRMRMERFQAFNLQQVIKIQGTQPMVIETSYIGAGIKTCASYMHAVK